MSDQSRLERLAEAQRNRRVQLAEIAAIALTAAFKKGLWTKDDMQLSVAPGVIIEVGNKKEKTTPWAEIYSAGVVALQERLNDPESTKYYERLQGMKTKLENLGGLASEAVTQIRGFKFGEVSRGLRWKTKEVAGTVFLVKSSTEDGKLIELTEIEIDRDINFKTPSAFERLRLSVAQLRERD